MVNVEPGGHAQIIRGFIRSLAGGADLSGMELVRLISRVANAYESAADEALRPTGLSGSRLALLIHLLAEERCGAVDGISPTHLSHHHRVSKNTISALLRGLEAQGFIERTLDPNDRRVFKIRLTDAGRQLIQTVAPQHIEFMNGLAIGLTAEEREQLITLLGKLHRALDTQRVVSDA